MSSLETDILQACFKRFDGNFASGRRANNKLELETIRTRPELRTRVAGAVSELASRHRPDMIVGVPNGANWLAIDIAWSLGTSALLLSKDVSTKTFSYHANGSKACETAERIVVVDDAFTAFTNTRKVLALPEINQRVVGVVGIWDRGNPEERDRLEFPVEALITVHIPPMLHEASPLWKFCQ